MPSVTRNLACSRKTVNLYEQVEQSLRKVAKSRPHARLVVTNTVRNGLTFCYPIPDSMSCDSAVHFTRYDWVAKWTRKLGQVVKRELCSVDSSKVGLRY
jgi:hypothetical protein